MPINLTIKKRLGRAKKASIEAQIRARLNTGNLHPTSKRFLNQIIKQVSYMRKHGKSEVEIIDHLVETRRKHEVLQEILENRQEKWSR